MLKTIKRLLTVIFILLLFGVGIAKAFDHFIWKGIYSNEELGESQIEVVDKETGDVKIVTIDRKKNPSGKPYTILLLGIDSNNIDSGRTDTLQIAVVQPKDKTITLMPIPRDLYVENQAKGKKDKINHAYNNGISNTISTIEKHFNIPINYYAIINFQGFIDVIDEMGGIKINVEKNIRFPDRITGTNFTLSKGEQTLSGIEALNYARYRGDAGGDIARNNRQQQVITALITETKSFQTITKVNSLIDIAKSNFKTNVSSGEIIKILQDFNFGNVTVNSLTMKAEPSRAGAMSIMVTSSAEQEKIRDTLHELLDISY